MPDTPLAELERLTAIYAEARAGDCDDRYRNVLDAYTRALFHHADWLLAQAREAAENRADAARYRWLRSSVGNPAYPMQAIEWGLRHITGDSLDAAIDAAWKGE